MPTSVAALTKPRLLPARKWDTEDGATSRLQNPVDLFESLTQPLDMFEHVACEHKVELTFVVRVHVREIQASVPMVWVHI